MVESCSTNSQPILGLVLHEKSSGKETSLEGIDSKGTQYREVASSQVPSRNPNQVKLAAIAARTIAVPSSLPGILAPEEYTPLPPRQDKPSLNSDPACERDDSKALATASRCALEKWRKGMPKGLKGERRYFNEIGGA